MKEKQLTVSELIVYLQSHFKGDEPVWIRTGDDPSSCYDRLTMSDIRNEIVSIEEETQDNEVELDNQCVLGTEIW